jgi:ribonuclease P protein component
VAKKQHTLGRTERLKSRKSLDSLFKQGKRFILPPFRVHYMPATDGLKFGAGVSTRNFKNAVDRNRVKRLIREAYRLQNGEMKAQFSVTGKGLHVFFIYTGTELPEYNVVFDKMALALRKLSGQLQTQ